LTVLCSHYGVLSTFFFPKRFLVSALAISFNASIMNNKIIRTVVYEKNSAFGQARPSCAHSLQRTEVVWIGDKNIHHSEQNKVKETKKRGSDQEDYIRPTSRDTHWPFTKRKDWYLPDRW
jgi:hypothetical protein